jgi:hypothetical protein
MRCRFVDSDKAEALSDTPQQRKTSQTVLKCGIHRKLEVVVDLVCIFTENFQPSQEIFPLLLVKNIRDLVPAKVNILMLVSKNF